MSQWTTSRPQQQTRAPHPGRDATRRPESNNHHTGHAARRNAYTIAHAGHHLRFGPVAFWIAVGTFVIMAGWSITTATYFAFHDDVIKGLIARQSAQQAAYEDRIAELRTRIDRTTSRQLLDQEQFEQKLDELMHRQAVLDSRATALSGIADPATTGSIRSGARAVADPSPKPAPLNDLFAPPTLVDHGKQSGIQTKLDRVAASLDSVERREIATVSQMQARYDDRTRQVRSVLDGLGLKFSAAPEGVGGPFIPVKMPAESEGFARALTRVGIARAQADDINNKLSSVPLRRPVTGEIDVTSPFGIRMDPFVHEAAMHTGMDFRGNAGEPIHATAAGKVTIAGWSGGYGQMIEIDHSYGLATRYGHLSEIDVTVGQTVHVGQVIGRLGSTGRSTGPHLHYETRINGEPVNPVKFLSAGFRLFGGS